MSAFTKAVDRQLSGLQHVSPGLTSRCATCNPDDLQDDEYSAATDSAGDEGGFSWQSCEGCGSSLGGNRYAAHGVMTLRGKETVVHLDVCADCLCYLANGDEPEDWER